MNMSVATIVMIVVIVAAIIAFFVVLSFINTWLKALLAGAPVSMLTLIAMRLRGVPYGMIVDSRIMAVKAGLDLTINQLEEHYLAEGSLIPTIQALIAAEKAGMGLTWKQACAIDLATKGTGKTVVEACEEPVNVKFLYDLDMPLRQRVELIAKEVYGADGVDWAPLAVEKAKRFESEFGLSAYDARHLVEHRSTSNFFEACMQEAAGDSAKLAKPLANLIINDVAAYANANNVSDMAETALSPARAVELVKLLAEDTISSKQAKEVFAIVLDEDKDPSAIIEERGMKQVSDTGAIEAVVDGVLAAFPDKVEQYKGGKTGLLGFFVGQCMKQMKGQGNPKVINQLLAKKLG